MKTAKQIIAPSLAAIASLLLAFQASAQCPEDQAVFVIDQSGSMLSDGSTGDPKWEIGRDLALNYFDGLSNSTEVAIVTFGNTSTGGSPFMATPVPFSAGLVKGADDATLEAALMSAASPNSLYLTPLAGSACDSIEMVFLSDPTCTFETARNVYLITDGLENSTPTTHDCYSATSSTTLFDPGQADAGFGLLDGSWQWKLANMAWTGNPNLESLPPPPPPLQTPRPVVNVSLLFNEVNSLAVAGGPEGLQAQGASLQALSADAIALFSGLAEVTHGTYFEAKTVGGVPTVNPVPGDTDPEPQRSCVDAADYERVLSAFGHVVRDDDPQFSGEDLARRDVTNDLVIDIEDYYLVINNWGRGC